MWSFIAPFVLKIFGSKIKDIVTTSWFKWVLLAIPFLILGGLLIKSKLDYSNLKEKYTEQVELNRVLPEDLAAAKHEILGLKAAVELGKDASKDINVLLTECHASLDRYEQGFQMIENNMAPDTTGTPVNKNEKGEQLYVPVTKKQNAAGIDFLNTQLGAIK